MWWNEGLTKHGLQMVPPSRNTDFLARTYVFSAENSYLRRREEEHPLNHPACYFTGSEVSMHYQGRMN